MSNQSGFIMEAGILTEYRGSGTDVVIPSGVKDIDWDAFEDCTDLTIYAEPDSYAERYAKNHHLRYKATGKRSNWCANLGRKNLTSIFSKRSQKSK